MAKEPDRKAFLLEASSAAHGVAQLARDRWNGGHRAVHPSMLSTQGQSSAPTWALFHCLSFHVHQHRHSFVWSAWAWLQCYPERSVQEQQGTIDRVINLVAMNLILSSSMISSGIIRETVVGLDLLREGEMLDLATSYLQVIFCGSLFVNFAQSSIRSA